VVPLLVVSPIQYLLHIDLLCIPGWMRLGGFVFGDCAPHGGPQVIRTEAERGRTAEKGLEPNYELPTTNYQNAFLSFKR
jgi:hypothetical protein